jgi:hypothetical protein
LDDGFESVDLGVLLGQGAALAQRSEVGLSYLLLSNKTPVARNWLFFCPKTPT